MRRRELDGQLELWFADGERKDIGIRELAKLVAAEMPRETLPVDKSLFTIPELAKLVGISRWRMARLIQTMGIPLADGKRRAVWLAQLRIHAPEIWDSVMLRRHTHETL